MGDNLKQMLEEFVNIVEKWRKVGLIEDRDLSYPEKRCLHSYLQYAMMKAGESVGMFPLHEYKARYDEKYPLDPRNYGLKDKKLKRHFKRVDVAFFKGRELVGISEIITIDGAHGCFKTETLAKVEHIWLTPRDSLLHLVKYGKERPEFIILVVTLPKKSSRIYWRTKIKEIDDDLLSDKSYYKVFKPYWIGTKKELEKAGTKCSLVIIHEDAIELLA